MIDLTPATEAMERVLDGVRDDQMESPTPCTEYTVGDIIDHVEQTAYIAAAVGRRDEAVLAQVGGAPRPVHAEPDWRQVLAEDLVELALAWKAPAAWEGPGALPGSDLPSGTWGRIFLTEMVVHGWDLAVATGQGYELDASTAQVCWEHVSVFLQGAPLPALWGPPVGVGEDAPLLDRIVAMTGRDPGWSPDRSSAA